MVFSKMLTEGFTRNSPFQAKVLERKKLNGDGSSKATYHLSLSLEGSGIRYKPGDAIGILPENPKELVLDILNACGLTGSETVVDPKTEEELSLSTFQSDFYSRDYFR